MRTHILVSCAVLCTVLAVPAWAQKGQEHGNRGHGGSAAAPETRVAPMQPDNREMGSQQGASLQGPFVIADRDRAAVSSYYREEFARGNCPPGLAKKHDGCMPPGQARKMWAVGQPLPPAVVYYPLPPTLYTRLTPPPPGYQYVRVDDDVLLMQSVNRAIVSLVVNLR